MALSNLIVKISADTKEFVVGTTRVKRDAEGLKSGMKMLSQAITEGSVRLKEMAAAGKGASKEYQELKTQVSQARSALRGMGGELSTLKKTADSGFGGRQIADALTGGLIGGGVAGLAITAIGSIRAAFTGAIQDASNLGETIAKTGVIFGDAQGQIQQFAEGAAQSIGQSKQQAMDAAATFGVFGKAAGLTGNELASFSVDLVKLSSDMASFSNTTPEQAITAIGAALRGEFEPIRQYGVLLNDAAMRQKAMELGIYDGNGALDAQQKILAAQALIFEQTTDAQGDFARTSQGLANQQRILSANLENISANLGSALLPIVNSVAGGMVSLIKQMKGFESASIDVAGAGRQVTDQLMSEQAEMNAMFNVLKSGNISTENRKKLLDEINTRYKPYLTNLIDETSSLDDIAKAQNSANVAFKESIRLKATQAMAAAAIEKQIALEKEALQIELDLENARVGNFKAIKSLGFSALGYQGATERLNYLLKLNREEAQKLQKEYGQIAAASQKATDAVNNAMGGVEESAGDAESAIDGGGGKFSDYAKQAGIFSGPSANTRKATEEYIKQLKETRDQLEIGSDSYKRVSGEIDKYEKSLQKTTTTQKKTKAVEVRVVSNIMGMDETTMFDLTDKMRKQVGEANILQGIFKNIDVLDVEINALSELIKEGVQAGVDPTVLQPYIDKLKELKQMKLGPQINVDEQSLQMSELMAGMATQIANDKRLAEAFGIQFNAIGAEAEALAEVIRAGVESNMDAELLQPLIDKYNQLTEAQRKLTASQQLASDVITGFGQTAASAFEAIGSGSMTAAQGFAAVGKAALGASLDFLKGKLLESVGLQTKFGAKYGPVGVAIAGAGIAALFALVKGAIAKSRAVAFAEGGIVSGPVMGLVGEYAGASRNPEVIAPLDKLQSMLQGSGSTHVTGTFRVQGSDLVLALDNAQRKMSQFRV